MAYHDDGASMWFSPSVQIILQDRDTDDGYSPEYNSPPTAASLHLESLNLSPGERSSTVFIYVPWKTIETYPAQYVGKANRPKVDAYFTVHLLKGRVWDTFVVHNSRTMAPIVMVPTVQFEMFLSVVNRDLATNLAIPVGAAGDKFRLQFGVLGRPLPKFMGRVADKGQFDQTMKLVFTFGQDDLSHMGPASLIHYQRWIEDIFTSVTNPADKKKLMKKRKAIDRQKGYSRMTKRAQRYLGLRERTAYALSSNTLATNWDVTKTVPYPTPHSVRFVCVDAEAYERDSRLVTEIGIAVLDTAHIEGICPGEDGKNWFPFINAHHLRISEYTYIVNYEFVRGCPGAFDFGKSQFVSLEGTSRAIGAIIGGDGSGDSRPIIVVGHDLGQDLKYLHQVGYNIWKHPQFVDEIDTQSMYHYLMRSSDGCGLGNMCANLGYPGRNFHNAGNDAYYTLCAMIIMAIKQRVKPQSHPCDPQDSWSDGDGDDGGVPVKSKPPPEEVPYQENEERDYGW